MNVIYKYELALTDEQLLNLPVGGVILSAQEQNNSLVLWVICSLDAVDSGEIEQRIIRIVGTGNPYPEGQNEMRFIDTIQSGPFVWHIFEKLHSGVQSVDSTIEEVLKKAMFEAYEKHLPKNI